jgi:hypothetical protein
MGRTTKRWLYYYAGRPGFREAAVLLTVVGLCFLLSSPGAADARSGPRTLSGITSQGQPGNIRLSGSGQMINEASITVQVDCSIGPMFLPQKFRLVPIKPGGSFRESLDGSDVDEDGTSIVLREAFSGKFNRDRTTAMVRTRIHLTIHDPDGTVIACDSGVVHLRVH